MGPQEAVDSQAQPVNPKAFESLVPTPDPRGFKPDLTRSTTARPNNHIYTT